MLLAQRQSNFSSRAENCSENKVKSSKKVIKVEDDDDEEQRGSKHLINRQLFSDVSLLLCILSNYLSLSESGDEKAASRDKQSKKKTRRRGSFSTFYLPETERSSKCLIVTETSDSSRMCLAANLNAYKQRQNCNFKFMQQNTGNLKPSTA